MCQKRIHRSLRLHQGDACVYQATTVLARSMQGPGLSGADEWYNNCHSLRSRGLPSQRVDGELTDKSGMNEDGCRGHGG